MISLLKQQRNEIAIKCHELELMLFIANQELAALKEKLSNSEQTPA